MVEGPGCKLKGEKLKPRVKGKIVEAVNGNAVEKHTMKRKRDGAPSGYHGNASSPFHEMVGQECADIKTLGKEFFMFFKGIDNCLRVHFLMVGGYRVNGQKIDGDGGGEADSPSLVLSFSSQLIVTFNKCAVDMRPATICMEKMDNLRSLDICDDAFSHKRAVEAVLNQGDRQVCDVLLDQEILPGVGNIIKNEALFDSGINPHSKVSELTEEHVSHLVKMTRDFSMIFYKCRRDGKPLNRYLKVYRKARCSQCEGKITNTRLGEDSERLTSFCVTCQVNDLTKLKSRVLPSKNSLLGWVTSGTSDPDWTCIICTLINKATNVKCSACLNPKKSTLRPCPSSQLGPSSSQRMMGNKAVTPCGVPPVKHSDLTLPSPKVSHVKTWLTAESHLASPQLNHSTVNSAVNKTLAPLQLHPVKLINSPSPLQKISTSNSPITAESPTGSQQSSSASSSQATKTVMQPTCTQHKKACLLREVRKQGPNLKRFFFSCPARKCNFFQWADENFPICETHGKRCCLRVVLKQGPNNGRCFFACSVDKKTKPCGFFAWADQYNHINIR